MIVYESPLVLPAGWVPANSVARMLPSSFNSQVSVVDAARYLEDEIHSLGATRAIISTNYDQLTSDRMRKKSGGHSNGAAVILRFSGMESHLACDKWAEVQHNLYALHLALRNIRMMEEWGVAAFYRLLSFFGNNSMHAPMVELAKEMNIPSWMQHLGLGPTAVLEDANAVYRRRVKELAENADEMLKLNSAIEEARKHLK